MFVNIQWEPRLAFDPIWQGEIGSRFPDFFGNLSQMLLRSVSDKLLNYPMESQISLVIGKYLQAIYSLTYHSHLKVVKAVHLKTRFESSPSTVHATLARMSRDNLILIGSRKEILLTPQGKKIAESVTRRHRLIEIFLYQNLQIPWHQVHKYADSWCHGLDPALEERLDDFLGFPQTCPHGSPLPGVTDFPPEDMIYLDKATRGDTLQIIVIGEQLEESESTLKLLMEKEILPGKRHHVRSLLQENQVVKLETDRSRMVLDINTASQIGVRRCQDWFDLELGS